MNEIEKVEFDSQETYLSIGNSVITAQNKVYSAVNTVYISKPLHIVERIKLVTLPCVDEYFGGAVMANLQVRLTDDLKTQADMLFASLGFDTSTAVRMFLTAAVEYNGLPFEVRHKSMSEEL